MNLNEVVPWGRSLAEYRGMFALTEQDLQRHILGCGDGPASFNAEMTAAHPDRHNVISIDPLYAFSVEQIRQRVEATYPAIIEQVKLNPHRYVWRHFADPDTLGQARLRAMDTFLADYVQGRSDGRYLAQSLPTLSFANGTFDLALCSHLLFLYSEQLTQAFHLAALQELLRVAQEVRVFPLLGLDCRLSPHVEPVQHHFRAEGYGVEICPVPYEFQRGGNQMMRIYRTESLL